MNEHDAAPAPGAPALSTHELTKAFGPTRVVDSLNLTIPRGAIYGFIGPNGSGKSTTMKMILGLLDATSGHVEAFGRRVDRRSLPALMARTGSMIEQPPGYGHLTGEENLRIVQRLRGLTNADADRALDLVGLTGHRRKLVKAYSLGMKQRLGIAMALAHRPDLLVLDEPTNGLDPAGIEDMRALMRSLASEGVTIMVSSHLLDEIDRTCSVLGILSAGRLVFQGTRAELMSRSVPDLVVVSSDPRVVADPATLAGLGARVLPDDEGVRLADLTREAGAELVRRLAAAGVDVYEARRAGRSLEEVFMDLTGQEGGLR
ncbi:ATP-binding cassette domain-containing protein [Actinomyces sp. B33]|uniref:ABC transporter ATP-binding protein n=1 Tax=Actinomyces sp. B33 TaxID=2942131 RepID=UPI0023401198|nr:ATP-binding cassette domain-containing protein [Actinomyces sp. B33]MDC4232696.1 ATP-binding cassette domain-containing protein [Actinomyces sp. B33]